MDESVKKWNELVLNQYELVDQIFIKIWPNKWNELELGRVDYPPIANYHLFFSSFDKTLSSVLFLNWATVVVNSIVQELSFKSSKLNRNEKPSFQKCIEIAVTVILPYKPIPNPSQISINFFYIKTYRMLTKEKNESSAFKVNDLYWPG